MTKVFNLTNTSGTLDISIAPGQLDGPGGPNTSTDLRLYGLGVHHWGEGVDENFLRLLESFAAPAKVDGDFNPVTELNDYTTTQGILPKDTNDLGIGKGITNPITGQLWYNTDVGVMYIFDEDVAGVDGIFGWKRDTGVAVDSTAPSSAQEGDLWYDTSTPPQLKVWNGSAWVSVADRYLLLSGGTMTGALDLGTNLISNVADPVNAQDAATKNYVDTADFSSQFVDETGDTMTGILILDQTVGSYLSIPYSSSTVTIGEFEDPLVGSDVRKTGNLLTSADGNVYIHFSTGNSFRVAEGGGDRGSGFTDLLTVTTSGLINVQSAYETLSLIDNSLVNKKYVDDEITSRTVEVTGGNFTGAITVNSNTVFHEGNSPTHFAQSTTPTANAVGDIWFEI